MNGYLGHAISLVTFDAVISWIIPALACFLIGLLLRSKGKMRLMDCLALSILTFYLAFVFTLTIYERPVTPEATMQLALFWSYKHILNGDKGMFFEVFWNIVMFMPYGILASILPKSKAKWHVLLSGALLSAAIELTQLISHRGLFEYDDIIHNTLGTIVGIALFYVAAKAIGRIEKYRSTPSVVQDNSNYSSF